MAQILVRNIDDQLKERLRLAAAVHGRSMEEEARQILHSALPAGSLPNLHDSHLGLGSRIHALFMDSDVPEDYFTAIALARDEGGDVARAAHLEA